MDYVHPVYFRISFLLLEAKGVVDVHMAQQETRQAFLTIWADFPAPFRHNIKDSIMESLEDGSQQRQICRSPTVAVRWNCLAFPQDLISL